MKVQITTLLFLTALFLQFSACKKDDFQLKPGQKSFPNVDRELWIYFQRFEEEGQKRGIETDLIAAGVTGKIQTLTEKHAIGQCTYGAAIGHNIYIDKTFWKSGVSELYRELVIFHELGHCNLRREHLEESLPNGTCKSIMRSGAGDCVDNYNPATRDTYLDELFSK